MREITAREEEIAYLRETEKLSFREIAGLYKITAARVSQVYRYLLRKRREQQRKEFYEEQNKKVISVDLTLGEVIVLQRILIDYINNEVINLPHTLGSSYYKELNESPDFISAHSIIHRLNEAENLHRVRLPIITNSITAKQSETALKK